jgi:hypothetical protein
MTEYSEIWNIPLSDVTVTWLDNGLVLVMKADGTYAWMTRKELAIETIKAQPFFGGADIKS